MRSPEGVGMTKEETIRELKILKENYWDDDGYGHETKQYDDTMSALNMAIKSLEQESVSREVYDNEFALRKEFDMKAYKLQRQLEKAEHNIDKIIAEIEQIEINGHIRDVECFRAGINVALNVINKYKAGNEG